MDTPNRAKLRAPGNKLIRAEVAPGRSNAPATPPTRHTLAVAIDDTAVNIGYRYGDSLSVGVTINTTTLMELIK